VPPTVLCKSNANEIRRITRIFDENKRTFVWSDISTIFRETYCLCDEDFSPHAALFRTKFVIQAEVFFSAGYDYGKLADLTCSKGYWNPKRKMWLTMHFSEVIN